MHKYHPLHHMHGDALKALGIANTNSEKVDLSFLDWALPGELRNLTFENVVVNAPRVEVIVMDSFIRDSIFSKMKNRADFLGSRNSWECCKFESITLHQSQAHNNIFTACTFERLRLKTPLWHGITFSNCDFTDVTIEGLKGVPYNSGGFKAHVDAAYRSKLAERKPIFFEGCKFRKTVFSRCDLSQVGFSSCEFKNTKTIACIFDGMKSDGARWWNPDGDTPFTAFLRESLAKIEKRFGTDHPAHRAFEKYVEEFLDGRNRSMRYFDSFGFHRGRATISEENPVPLSTKDFTALCNIFESVERKTAL